MSDGTRIAWTDATWNVVTGCTRISPGCLRCYIERTPPFRMEHRRFTSPEIGGSTDVRLHPDRLAQPLRWRKPRRVFVCSLADLFHAEVPADYIARVFAVMALAERHTFQVLTKRHDRMQAVLSDDGFARRVDILAGGIAHDNGLRCPDEIPWPLPNAHLVVSAENQKWADIRIPALRETPAAIRGVSAEPLLGPIDLFGDVERPGPAIVRTGYSYPTDYGTGIEYDYNDEAGIDWVVVGCESGPGARPMDLAWAEQVVTDCRTSGVPVLVKQLPTGPRGRATQDMATFPEHLRVRQYPAGAR